MRLNINISNKAAYTIIAVVIILAVVGVVYAFGGNQPAVMGHSANEIEGVCRTDGTGCPAGLGGGSGTINWNSSCRSILKTSSQTGDMQCAADEYLVDAYCSDGGGNKDCTITPGLGGKLTKVSGASGEARALCCKATSGGSGTGTQVNVTDNIAPFPNSGCICPAGKVLVGVQITNSAWSGENYERDTIKCICQ